MTEQQTIFNLIRQILSRSFSILMVSLIAAFSVGIASMWIYTPQYRTQALITVYSRNSSSVVYKAQETANVFKEVITSNLLQKKVAEAIGEQSLPGSLSCSNVTNTNMITLAVTADTPQNAMTTINAVLEHHQLVTEKLLRSMVLQVLETPSVPVVPLTAYRPVRMLLISFAAAAALQCAVLLCWLYLRDDIKHEQEVEAKLDTTLFATVYHEDLHKGFRMLRRNRSREHVGLLISNPVTSFGYIETIQKMTVRLEYQAKEQNIKTIVISSMQENEGKSTIAANLALTLIKMDKKVLLVDLDLRKPALFKLFETVYENDDPQIGDMLSGKAAPAYTEMKMPEPNLYLLAGRRSYANAEQLLDQTRSILDALKDEVDYVIIDTPPMAAAADAEMVIQCADAALLVVRQNVSVAKDINDGIDLFRAANCHLFGCVFNNVQTGLPGSNLFRGKEYDYHYQKRYGNNYGKRDET